MTDTTKNIADDLDAMASRWASDRTYMGSPVDDVREIAERLRALSARASAGEGGEWVMVPREPLTTLPRGWLIVRDRFGYMIARDAGGNDTIKSYSKNDEAEFLEAVVAATPQPAAAQGQWLVELVAKAIYSQWTFMPGYVEWVERGNSIRQDDARELARAHIAAAPQPQEAPVQEWRCFHCDEAFTDRDAAAIHFGTHEYQRPACLIDAAEYRRMEAKEARYAEEDADVHRAMYAQQGAHALALVRAEEAGYAKGLRDSGKCPCATPQPAAASEWVMVPRRLTAENGAKGLLSGEFCEHFEFKCAECDDDGMVDGETPCDDCDGRGSHRVKVPVEWTTIKAIHRMVVEHLAAAPQPQADECPACKLGQATCGYHARNPTTPPAHGDGEGDYAAKWFAECRRVLEDVSTEMRATGRGDTRFRRLIESMPRQRTTRPTPEVQGARDAVQWAHDEFEDKEHVARVRGDIGLADYYGVCKAKMAAALALPAQGEGS